MAVKVTKLDATGSQQVTATHPSATGIDVKDGHLLVQKPNQYGHWEPVAVYAPGQWTDATTEELAEK
jgi:hypothetical protein